MSKVYDLLKENLGMGREPLDVLQLKAQRIAALSSLIAEKLFGSEDLNMTPEEIADAALVMRTVHAENEGMYNGKEPFDFEKNKQRGEYSLKVASEKGIALTDEQVAVVRGNSGLIEEGIIKVAETIIAVQYDRIQRGVTKKAITQSNMIIKEMANDARVNQELLGILNADGRLENVITAEMLSFSTEKSPKAPSKNVEVDR